MPILGLLLCPQRPMLLSASYAKMPFSTGISPFPYGCRIRADGGFKAPPSLIRKKGMDKNVSKPGKRHDFPGFSYAAPGENLFDESRIHAAFARRPRYAGSSDSGRCIIICFTSLIASSAESDASVVSKRHAANTSSSLLKLIICLPVNISLFGKKYKV